MEARAGVRLALPVAPRSMVLPAHRLEVADFRELGSGRKQVATPAPVMDRMMAVVVPVPALAGFRKLPADIPARHSAYRSNTVGRSLDHIL